MTRTREENARDEQRAELEREERLDEDWTLSAEQLDDKYNPEGDGEHPDFTRDHWREDVAEGTTISGYWDWLVYRIDVDRINAGW